jgi:hypothetical protein
MLIPREALEKAVQGGWRTYKDFQFANAMHGPRQFVMLIGKGINGAVTRRVWEEGVALDAGFWQGLGAALGWSNRDVGGGYSGWADNAHKFYDLMLTGQPTDQFWKKTLSSHGRGTHSKK